MYLHGVGDPGNVGTILRGASAFGAGSVALGPQTADPYSPKAVRASMGAVFEVPLVRIGDQLELGTAAGNDGRAGRRPTASRSPKSSSPVRSRCWSDQSATGCRPELVSGADTVARIPIANHSLNAAMAATVALYELSRMAR